MRRRLAVTRLGCLALAIGAAGWAFAVFRTIPDFGAINEIGNRIGGGEGYRPEVVRSWAEKIEPTIAGTCDGRVLTSALMIVAKAAEIEIASAQIDAIDRRLDAVRRTALRVISCAPVHSFAWLALYWVESVRSGFDPKLLGYLEQSYKTGPREIWVSLRRNPMAMAVFEALPPALQERAIDEFIALVQAVQLDGASTIFVRLDDGLRQRIVPRLAEVPYNIRNGFSRKLSRLGLDIALPGVAAVPERPWIR